MGRIAVIEDVEGIREEEDVGDVQTSKHTEEPMSEDLEQTKSPSLDTDSPKGKYIATVAEVQEAFDSINTLRYSQPTHLQGRCLSPLPPGSETHQN